MKVFVLEDNPDRITFFRKMFQGYDLIIETNVNNAIKSLETNEFHVLFLDHDLGGLTFVDPEAEETGATVVRYMIKKKLQKQAIFFIHSQNPIGAAYMLNLLMDDNRRAFLKSFTSIYHENKVGF